MTTPTGPSYFSVQPLLGVDERIWARAWPRLLDALERQSPEAQASIAALFDQAEGDPGRLADLFGTDVVQDDEARWWARWSIGGQVLAEIEAVEIGMEIDPEVGMAYRCDPIYDGELIAHGIDRVTGDEIAQLSHRLSMAELARLDREFPLDPYDEDEEDDPTG